MANLSAQHSRVNNMIHMLQAAKAAKPKINLLSTEQKNNALEAMANALIANMENILSANMEMLTLAEKHNANYVLIDDEYEIDIDL